MVIFRKVAIGIAINIPNISAISAPSKIIKSIAAECMSVDREKKVVGKDYLLLVQ